MVTASPTNADSPADEPLIERDGKYVLQIKLKRHEKEAVEAAAKAAFLPRATWARQIVLRHAGLRGDGSVESPAPTSPPVAVADGARPIARRSAARAGSRGGKKAASSRGRSR